MATYSASSTGDFSAGSATLGAGSSREISTGSLSPGGFVAGDVLPLGSIGHVNCHVTAVDTDGQLLSTALYMTQPTRYGRVGHLSDGSGILALAPRENTVFHVVTEAQDGTYSVWESVDVSLHPIDDPDPYVIPFEKAAGEIASMSDLAQGLLVGSGVNFG